MATSRWCGLGPLLLRKKISGIEMMNKNIMKGSCSYMFSKPTTTTSKKPKLSKPINASKKEHKPSKSTDNVVLMMKLRRRILILRDIIELPPYEDSASMNELVVGTTEDLQKLYSENVWDFRCSGVKARGIEQNLVNFCTALKSVGDSWSLEQEWRDKLRFNLQSNQPTTNLNTIAETVLGVIECIINMANERFDMMMMMIIDSPRASSVGKTSMDLSSETTTTTTTATSSYCSSPETPTSVLANYRTPSSPTSKSTTSCRSPRLWSLRVQAVEKLNPIAVTNLMSQKLTKEQETVGKTESLPDSGAGNGQLEIDDVENENPREEPSAPAGIPPPPPPPPQVNVLGTMMVPPPPPVGAWKSLRPKKAATKLKRSHQMGNLYRTLKGKVEGSDQNGKLGSGRRGGVGSSGGGKLGMADALKEMTRRSAYFQQIEEDVKQYANSITELKSSISTFQSKDMNQLHIFHNKVESVLEHLTDESQVLARFEGFPIKKLECLRMAAALYSKLDAIINELQNWKIVPPLGPLLDKVENYFTKIKGEIDALERIKDEELKKFRSYGIQFDFNILIRIKESMVDVSSCCMELALKERRELMAEERNQNGVKSEGSKIVCVKMLWRAFQFAYRVYSFAGGHDDRADRLTRELAREIESHPQAHHH